MLNLIDFAQTYNQRFRFNIIPVSISKDAKKTTLKSWKKWQSVNQTFSDINKFTWNGSANGIAYVNRTVSSLDFDKCSDEFFILTIAKELGLTEWLVRTGFGYHIHLVINNIEALQKRLGDAGVLVLQPKPDTPCKQIEIRIKGCYTILPPSLHYNGKQYEFLNGFPTKEPSSIDSEKLIEVIEKYFVLNVKQNQKTESKKDEILNYLNDGVAEGNRHKALTQIFGVLFDKGFDKGYIFAQLKNWNKSNRPPLDEKHIEFQVNDLWKRYSKGLDGIFHQFHNCLMALPYTEKIKLKKILCFSVMEYNSNQKVLQELGLLDQSYEYHKECREFIDNYESITGKKDQIVRVGERLMLDVIEGKFNYETFSVYVGIISFQGRKKIPKKIAYSIIALRAMGYKTFNDYLASESIQEPLSNYRIKKAIDLLEQLEFIITFSFRAGQMRWFTTKTNFIKNKNELGEYVMKRNEKKFDRKIEEEEIRQRLYAKLREKELRYKKLKQLNRVINSPLIDSNMIT